jgi:hypothetical protein
MSRPNDLNKLSTVPKWVRPLIGIGFVLAVIGLVLVYYYFRHA